MVGIGEEEAGVVVVELVGVEEGLGVLLLGVAVLELGIDVAVLELGIDVDVLLLSVGVLELGVGVDVLLLGVGVLELAAGVDLLLAEGADVEPGLPSGVVLGLALDEGVG